MIGIGMSQKTDSTQTAQEAARMAMDNLPNNDSVAWALVFSGGKHNQDAIIDGVRSQLGEVEIVGGTAVGSITNSSIGYTGYELALAVFTSSIPKPTMLAEGGLDKGEAQVGKQLGTRLRDVTSDGDTVLLFYDSVRSAPPPVLNVGSRLMDGLYEGLAGKHLNMVGAGTIGDFQITESHVFDGYQSVKNTAVAVALPSLLKSKTIIMHGCIPVSSFLEITRIDGPIIYELDGRAALTVLQELLGIDQGAALSEELSLVVTLGAKHGDPYAPYDESAYVNRLIISTNPADGSVTLFEADFQVGTKVQIMSRDNQLMVKSVRKRTGELLKSLGRSKPAFAFYIDCAGRTNAFSGSEIEEASVLQTELGREIPLLGFYSGVEIAPLMGKSRPLDWTGVLTLFAMENANG
jgi:hypothetical protein